MSTTNFDEITTEVTGQVNIQNTRATNAITDAQQFLIALQNAALYTPEQITTLTPVNVDIVSPTLGAIPPARPTAKLDALEATIPTEPADFNATVADRAIQDSPQEQFNDPSITFPDSPVFTEEVKPSKTETNLPNAVTKPTLTIPGELTVSDQTTPNIPSIALPNFGEAIPTISIALPETTLAYVEPVYTSALKTELSSNLLSKIQTGGTGLNATIEGNIYNRDVERLAQKLDDDIDDALNRFAGRGFTMPPGTVAAQVQELQINHTNERANQSRDVAIQMAKIADVNTKAFLEMGLNWEQILINHANNIANRSLEAEKSVIEFGIASFNSKITKFNAELARYQAKDIEVQSNIRIQELKLSQYESELRGVEADATKDRVSVENYRAKLTAHDAQVRLYEAETAATVAALNIERAKIEIFKTDIDDYVARIGAKKNEYDLFLAEVQGERSKIDLYRANVETYATRVNAVKVNNDVIIEKVRSDIEVERLNLQAHLANVEVYKEKSQQAIQRIAIEKDLYGVDAGKYRDEIRLVTAQGALDLEATTKANNLQLQNADLELQRAIHNMNSVNEQSKVRVSAAEGAMQGYIALATIAAGVIQTMYQLGTQGTDSLNTSATE